MTPPPEPVLTRVAAGDPDAVAQCLELHAPLVYGMARRWMGGSADVDDLVQDVFVQIWKQAQQYDPSRASERGWIAMITRRKLIDRTRRGNAGPVTDSIEETLVAETVGSADEGLRAVDLKDDSSLVRKAFDSLDEDVRDMLYASIVDGQSHHKIAESTGLPLGTVKSRLRRALIRVRDILGASATSAGGAKS